MTAQPTTQADPGANTPSGRVVLVTGSARGLGLATAKASRERGDHVHVVWRTPNESVRALERQFPGRTHRADLAEPDAARALVEAVAKHDGRLDVLVHAVGEFRGGSLAETSVEDVEHLFASNVTTSVRLFDAARAGLRSAHGCALFFGVAGLDGLRGRRETAAYAAAKSALLVLVRSWAIEEAPHGVRVNMLSPGIVPHAHADEATLDERRQARIPAGRPGTPEEVASAALFLCSDAARYVTGADLPVAGGYAL